MSLETGAEVTCTAKSPGSRANTHPRRTDCSHARDHAGSPCGEWLRGQQPLGEGVPAESNEELLHTVPIRRSSIANWDLVSQQQMSALGVLGGGRVCFSTN